MDSDTETAAPLDGTLEIDDRSADHFWKTSFFTQKLQLISGGFKCNE